MSFSHWLLKIIRARRPYADFGPFAELFRADEESCPLYMELLHIQKPGASLAVRSIEAAIAKGDTQRWATNLLIGPNWRAHLPGALTALTWSEGHKLAPYIWQAIDSGSWVTPQLVATAVFTDKDFAANAQKRVSAGCPVYVPQGLSSIARHSATGPAGPVERSAKMLASILAMCENTELGDWADDIKNTPEVESLLQQDVDNSGKIASSWADSVEELLTGLQGR